MGGMEKYVFDLTHALVLLGLDVSIICEEVTDVYDPAITIKKLEIPKFRHRWQSMLAFREAVAEFCRDILLDRKIILHSHERSICHHITTFHGPPLAPRSFFDKAGLNRRYNAWTRMECDELMSCSVQKILCVSSLVQSQLVEKYPSLDSWNFELAWPGYSQAEAAGDECRPQISTPGLRVVFVGKEWRRKGLSLAYKVIQEFRSKYSQCSLDVYGPKAYELPGVMKRDRCVRVHGWVRQIPWGQFDVLLHPAKHEPFGMVVQEARARGLPVLMSDQVGARDLNFSETITLGIDDSLNAWVDALFELSQIPPNSTSPEIKWTVRELAELHVRLIYPQVFERINRWGV